MDSIVFLHSKGADTRRKILQSLYSQNENEKVYCVATLAEKFSLSKVAIKKHIDYLNYLGYVDKINPNGKPIFLQLTPRGVDTAKKYV